MFKKSRSVPLIEELVRKAQQGNTDAFGHLYELLLDDMFRYVYFRVANRDAGDICEDIFVKAWENLHQYRSRKKSSFRAWIFTIARNVIIDYYRKNREVISVDNIVLLEDEEEQRSPHFDINNQLTVAVITHALRYLKEDAQQVIILKYMNELSNEEIADIMGKSVTAIRIIVHRALKELRHVISSFHNVQ